MIHDIQWSVDSLGIKIVFCADTYIHVHTLSVVSIQFCVSKIAKCRLLSTLQLTKSMLCICISYAILTPTCQSNGAQLELLRDLLSPNSWLLLDMKIQVKPQRVLHCMLAQPIYTCSLTMPRSHTLLLHGRGCVLPSVLRHPRQFKVEVLVTVLSYWNSMYVVMYADIPSSGFSILTTSKFSCGSHT